MSSYSPISEDSKLNRLLRWRAGESAGPWQMVVFPTNRCNLKCGICWQRGVEEKTGKFDYSRELSDARFLALVDEAAELGVKEWSIAGGGEPFVRAALVMNMCSRIREQGMNGGLYTNGTLVKREHLEHLVDIEWNRLDLSLDGSTAQINDAIRSGESFQRATEMLGTLNEIKQEKNKEFPIVDIHCVLTTLNLHDMEEMIHLAKNSGAHDIGFSILQVESKQCARFEFSPEDWKELPSLAAKAAATAEHLEINTNVSALIELNPSCRKNNACSTTPNDKFIEAGCFEPFLSVAVLSEGYVGPCCSFWDDAADNLQKHSLKEVWTGPWFQDMRERMFSHNFPDFCEHCPSHFIWLTEKMRSDLKTYMANNPPPPRSINNDLAKRITDSVKNYGLYGSLRRGWEWVWITAKHKAKLK